MKKLCKRRRARARCEIMVHQRSYSIPGQCESRRGVERVKLGDTPIRACIAHRKLLLGGRVLEVAR